jgi:ABC-type nickel/cobalt efflux system permease component RcnA
MLGLDDLIASSSDGTTVLIVLVVAILLGLRHATDPDHLAAVTTLAASGGERSGRRAASLGLSWGLGHATALFALGVPIVLYRAYLPEAVQRGVEAAIGLLIVGLAVWLLVRWRRGVFHVHLHEHGGSPHVHVHTHGRAAAHAHGHAPRVRTRLQAYGIGLVHGVGGSAGVGILLLSTIGNHALAVVALALFAAFTAVSMALVSTGFGLTLTAGPMRRSFAVVAPALGVASLAFGVWYALGALSLAPYYF